MGITKVDKQELHRRLWERTDRLGRVRIKWIDIANEYGITKFTMSRIAAKMEEDGLIEKIGTGYQNICMYKVNKPE